MTLYIINNEVHIGRDAAVNMAECYNPGSINRLEFASLDAAREFVASLVQALA